MKKQPIAILFILSAIVGITMIIPSYADHPTAEVDIPTGTSVPGCETTNECFIPYEVTVDVGGEVTWTNSDTAAHTVTSGTPGDGPDGSFDSSLFMADTTFSHKFEEAGTYDYFCMVHPWMEGIVTVQSAEATDEMHDEDSKMKSEDDATVTGMTEDGSIMASLYTSTPTMGERMEIKVQFTDPDGNMLEHVNYDLVVTQNGNVVLPDEGAHAMQGTLEHLTGPLDSDDPVNIEITFQGFGMSGEERTGPIGEKIVFTNVVPEFGTIAILILTVAIISIIGISAKTKMIPKI